MRRIIVHSGLPKTGSSALQRACYDARVELSQLGLMYDADIHAPHDPKHTWAIQALRNPRRLHDMRLERLDRPEDVLISTESITNELPFLTPDSCKQFVDTLSVFGPLEFVVVTREPEDWMLSYYRQAVVNQPSRQFEFYATALRFSDFRQLPHVRMLADRRALAKRMEAVFGSAPRFVKYGPNVIQDMLAEWGARDLVTPKTSVNTSLKDVPTEILRQLNGGLTGMGDKCGWARVMDAAGLGGGSVVLSVLSGRATAQDLAALVPAHLDALHLDLNPPLKLDPETFAQAKAAMIETLAEIQRG